MIKPKETLSKGGSIYKATKSNYHLPEIALIISPKANGFKSKLHYNNNKSLIHQR